MRAKFFRALTTLIDPLPQVFLFLDQAVLDHLGTSPLVPFFVLTWKSCKLIRSASLSPWRQVRKEASKVLMNKSQPCWTSRFFSASDCNPCCSQATSNRSRHTWVVISGGQVQSGEEAKEPTVRSTGTDNWQDSWSMQWSLRTSWTRVTIPQSDGLLVKPLSTIFFPCHRVGQGWETKWPFQLLRVVAITDWDGSSLASTRQRNFCYPAKPLRDSLINTSVMSVAASPCGSPSQGGA